MEKRQARDVARSLNQRRWRLARRRSVRLHLATTQHPLERRLARICNRLNALLPMAIDEARFLEVDIWTQPVEVCCLPVRAEEVSWQDRQLLTRQVLRALAAPHVRRELRLRTGKDGGHPVEQRRVGLPVQRRQTVHGGGVPVLADRQEQPLAFVRQVVLAGDRIDEAHLDIALVEAAAGGRQLVTNAAIRRAEDRKSVV